LAGLEPDFTKAPAIHSKATNRLVNRLRAAVETMVQKPAVLKKGDMIRAVAPASTERDPAALSKGLAKLRELGFNVSLGDCVRKLRTWGYLSGTDQQRAEELNEAFRGDNVDAVFCVRGGYGTPRILPYLDYDLIRSNPKIFLGYSDITTLHITMNQKSDLVTFHGPMIASDIGSEFTDYTEKWFLRATTSPEPLGEITNPIDGPIIKTINDGEASGKLVGGNLSLMVKTLGTTYEIDTKNKILFIEDTDNPPYGIDGNLTHLWLAHKLQDAAGIIVGEITKCEPHEPEPSLTLWDVLKDRVGSTGKPAIYGLCCGHGTHHSTLPIGVEARLDATQGRVWIEESATRS
jgi:muramoyltetrapeptide carboxypeptidase